MIKVNGILLDSILFPNKELLVDTKFSLVSGVATVEFKFETNQDILELYFVLNHIKDIAPETKTTLIIQYMPYSRMDRSQNNSCFTLKHVVSLLTQALPKSSKVYVVEPHSSETLAQFERNNIYASSVFVTPELVNAIVKSEKIDLICYPDKGACKRYSEVFGNVGIMSVYCNKVRDFATGNIIGLELVGEDLVKDRNILIVDDLCSKGGTFYHTAHLLKDKGANEVHLCVAHLEDSVRNGCLIAEDSPLDSVWATTSLLSQEMTNELTNLTFGPHFNLSSLDTINSYNRLRTGAF